MAKKRFSGSASEVGEVYAGRQVCVLGRPGHCLCGTEGLAANRFHVWYRIEKGMAGGAGVGPKTFFFFSQKKSYINNK